MPFGARPSGLGDAFVAVADDGNAVYWNPAGIATLGHHELNTMTTNSFNIGLQHRFLSYIFPLSDKHSLGLGWFHEGFSDDEIDFGWNIYQLSYGRNFIDKFSVGSTFKYARYSFNLDSESLDNPSGFGFDLGLLYTYRRLKFGFLIQDIGGLSVKHESGLKENVRDQAIRVGLSYYPFNYLLFASSLTFNDRINFGAEYWVLGNRAALRVGLQRDIYDTPSPETIYSVGASVKYRIFQFDYSYSIFPTLTNNHRFSVSLAYSFSRSKVMIKHLKINNLYASRFKDYSNKIFGGLVLENREKIPVNAEVNIYVEDLMDKPETVFKGVLRAHDKKPIPLKATLSEKKVFKITQDNLMQASIDISYVTSEKAQYRKKTQKTTKFYIYAPGAVSWAKGPAAAASYITQNDPIVENFAKNILKQYSEIQAAGGKNLNLLKAAILFDAIGRLGIRYEPDTIRPFGKVSRDSIATDNIRYPRQMLQKNVRFGDCDDLTVLLASLLEAVNIETSVAMAPGHLYLFFNSGILRRSADKILADPEFLFIDDNDRIWIPLETTKLGQSFKEAIKAGANHKIEAIADVHRVWKYFQPAFPLKSTDSSSPPKRKNIDQLFNNDYQFITTRGINEYIRKLEIILASSPNDPNIFLKLGKAYREATMLSFAEKALQKVVEMNGKVYEAKFILGLIFTDQNRYEKAMEQATQLQREFPSEARGYLLTALIYWAQNQYKKAKNWYLRAKQVDPNSMLLQKYNILLWFEYLTSK
ncbi:MAG: tetratricopeptide repeat protein [bacterium]